MDELQPTRFETSRSMLIAGIAERYTFASSTGIPSQWQRFLPHLGKVHAQVGNVAYGVMYNGDDRGFDYLCGIEVRDVSDLPAGWNHLVIAVQRYAVFAHRDHVSSIRRTHDAIWRKWLPASGYEPVRAPMFERYGEEFSSSTGPGGLEIWIPIRT